MLRALLWAALIIVLIFTIIVALIHVPAIQNRLAHYATSFVSNRTHSVVKIKEISISIPKSIVLKGLYLEDIQKDTLLYAGTIKADIALFGLIAGKISIGSVSLEDLYINLYNTGSDSLFNYRFLLSAFSDTAYQAEVEPASPSQWTFSIDHVNLENIRLRYNDEFGGMNMDAMLGSLNLKMDGMDLGKSIFDMNELLIERLDVNALLSDPADEQSVFAAINRFEMKNGSFDLQREIVTLDKLAFSKSEIHYHTFAGGSYPDTSAAEDVTTPSGDWKVHVKSILLDDNALEYQVENRPEIINAFDVNHLAYSHLTIEMADLYYSSDSTGVSIKKFSATDHNHFQVTEFKTDFRMDQHSVTARDLHIKTSRSRIVADFSAQYSGLSSLQDSLGYLKMNVDLENVSVHTSDILYFSPQLSRQPFFSDNTNITTISGMINGQVNHLRGKNLLITTGARTVLKTDFSITGLPDMESAHFDLPNLTINTGKRDIEMMAGPSVPDSIGLPENINIRMDFKGKLSSFESSVAMGSSYGPVNLYATLDENENFEVKVDVAGFNLGSLMNDTAMFGPVTLVAGAGGQGLDMKTARAKISAEVSRFYLNGYTYRHLTLDGLIKGQKFEGRIKLDDENVKFDLEGLADLQSDRERYAFQLNLAGADLQKLNITKDDLRVGMVAAADMQGGNIEKLNGKLEISNMIIVKGEKVFEPDSLSLTIKNEPGKSEFSLSSALIDVKYSGTGSPLALPEQLAGFINNYFSFSDSLPATEYSDPSNFNFEIQLHHHPILSEVLLPQLKAFEPGIIQGSFDSEKGELELNGSMKKIVYGTIEIKDLVMALNSNPAELNYVISGSGAGAQIKSGNFLLEGKLADNVIYANVSSIDEDQNKKLAIRSQITRDKTGYKLHLDPEGFYLMNNRWDIAGDNYIRFGEEGFLVHHLFMSHAGSRVNVASVNDRFNDDLNIEIVNFRLGDLSRIIEKDSPLAGGTLNGNVLLKRVNQVYGIIAGIEISDLTVYDVPIGDLTINVNNPVAERFDIDVKLTGAENNLTVKGHFLPGGGENSIAIVADIQSLSMKTMEAFSMGQITEASGTLTGEFAIQGSASAPRITGTLVFNDAFLKPALLNNRLELKHETIQLKEDGIYFQSFTLTDPDQKTAVIDGSIQMKEFEDFIFNLQVSTKDFLIFNTTANDNEQFFGRMIIDSRIEVSGPMDLLVIDAKIKMKEGSDFTFVVPESKLTTYKGEDVVEFEVKSKQSSILYRKKKNAGQKSGFSGFDLSSVIEVDKQASLHLLMDPSSSDELVVKGEAALSLTMDRSGKMSLTGAYYLNEGSYLVTLQSMIKKKFDIAPGSVITWNGDVMDAEISINAVYTVRTSPIDLVAGQMSGLSEVEKGAYKQRYPFLVLLKLRGRILQPEIGFEIQLPSEYKGILGGAVNAKLNTLNDDPSALNKQVFALLIAGRFIQENPLQSDANRGAAAMVRSTVGRFLSDQLNQLTSKVAGGVELNFDIQSYDDYSSGQAEGRTEVEIGLKKELFNERLTVQVGGTVDVEGEKVKQNTANDITSDVIIEYRLTEDGRYRLRGFRNIEYESAIEGQITETGIGVSYVRDFNKWRYFFRAPQKTKEK
ncbi:MAG: translocation/assembly module TamB domain-containing protein [Bacteroidales bacterium]|nr:translocation/assembly module TamB domain-containing protein [Bacteroidales bacterium]